MNFARRGKEKSEPDASFLPLHPHRISRTQPDGCTVEHSYEELHFRKSCRPGESENGLPDVGPMSLRQRYVHLTERMFGTSVPRISHFILDNEQPEPRSCSESLPSRIDSLANIDRDIVAYAKFGHQ